MRFPLQMDLTGIKHPEKIQAIQWCECRGKHHRLAIINNGIVLLDHDLTREMAMLDLGGEVCRCMRVLLELRKGETKHVLDTFAPYVEEMTAKQAKRKYARNWNCVPVTEKDLPPKDVRWLVPLFVRYKCRYPQIDGNTVISVTSTGGRPFVKGLWCYQRGIGDDKFILLQINVSRNWKRTVYDRGVAVVDEHLVLGLQSNHPDKDLTCSGDVAVVIMACHGPKQGFQSDTACFGNKNATVAYMQGKWRFKYMDNIVYGHDYGSVYCSLNHAKR